MHLVYSTVRSTLDLRLLHSITQHTDTQLPLDVEGLHGLHDKQPEV